MRIDGTGPAGGHGDAREIRPARSAADDPRAADKNTDALAGSVDLSGSRVTVPGLASRVAMAAAYRAKADAVYRQHAITKGDAQADGPKSGSDGPPRAAPGGGGSAGDGRGRQPPPGDVPSGPEGEDPEGVNGGLGELVRVNAKDRAAGALAERIGGEASVRFADGPANEFDAVSEQYVAQAKPANFTLNKAFRDQAKATFEVAAQSGRTPYFQFDGPPGPGVLRTLDRYADRYGIEPVIDLTPLRGN
jgi:Restriction endonuclease fold toxin 3